MRKVKYLVGTSNWNHTDSIREGIFHGFVSTSDTMYGINYYFIVAMIEIEDGSVLEIKAERIRFIKE